MDEPIRPTKEAIEAAISAYKTPIVLTEEMDTFQELLKTSGAFNGTAYGSCAAVLSTAQEIYQEVDPEEIAAFIAAQDPAAVSRFLHAVMQFFWIGWHARGAQEDARRLAKML